MKKKITKYITAGILSISLLAGSFPLMENKAEAAVFSDTYKTAWAAPSIENLYKKGILKGTGEGTFSPSSSVTRAEFAAMLERVVNKKAATSTFPFTDVSKKKWYYDAVKEAYQMDELFARKIQPLLGTPYRFGGTTTAGFDCSGFTQYVYKSMGINLPRTTGQQFTKGMAVSLKSMQPGDILFFDTGSGSISHNGIYMGNGKMAHAATGQGSVKINDLDWYIEHYRVVGVKRYL